MTERDDKDDLREIGERIRTLVTRLGGAKTVAPKLGVSPEQVRKWMRGAGGRPRATSLAALAALAGVSLDSIVGTEPAPAPMTIDGELLGRLFEALEKVYRDEGVRISTRELGSIVGAEYPAAANSARSEWPTVVRLISDQHRKRLREEPMKNRTRRGA